LIPQFLLADEATIERLMDSLLDKLGCAAASRDICDRPRHGCDRKAIAYRDLARIQIRGVHSDVRAATRTRPWQCDVRHSGEQV